MKNGCSIHGVEIDTSRDIRLIDAILMENLIY